MFFFEKESSGFMRRIPPNGRKLSALYKHKPAAAKTPPPNSESKEGKIIHHFLLNNFQNLPLLNLFRIVL